MQSMGGFEVQNLRGHEGGKYLHLFAGGMKSSIVGNHFGLSRFLSSVNTAQVGKVLHMFIVCFA